MRRREIHRCALGAHAFDAAESCPESTVGALEARFGEIGEAFDLADVAIRNLGGNPKGSICPRCWRGRVLPRMEEIRAQEARFAEAAAS